MEKLQVMMPAVPAYPARSLPRLHTVDQATTESVELTTLSYLKTALHRVRAERSDGIVMIRVEVRSSRGEILDSVSADPKFNPVLLGVDCIAYPILVYWSYATSVSRGLADSCGS